VFPRSGKPWAPEDLDLIHSIIADIPDDRIDDHILWLSKKLQRTPYAITLKIVSEGRMNEEWAKGWKPAANLFVKILLWSGQRLKQTIQIINERS
jgi:intergrase/recombinase